MNSDIEFMPRNMHQEYANMHDYIVLEGSEVIGFWLAFRVFGLNVESEAHLRSSKPAKGSKDSPRSR